MDGLSADVVEQSKSYLSQLWWYQQQHSNMLLRTPGGDTSRPSSSLQSHTPISANTSDSINQLCRVCGEPAAGFHFGAFTCEGCKSFFGRTYNNLSSISECKNGNQCVINKKNRTSCKACRLRKCLVVGMSKSGSRYGRRSNWFKIHCLLQEQSNNNNNNSIQSIQAANIKKVESWNEKNCSPSPPRTPERSNIRSLEVPNFTINIKNIPQLRNIDQLRNLPELRSLELHNISSELLHLRSYEDTHNITSRLNNLPIEFHNLPNLALHNLPLELRNYLSKIAELQNNMSSDICNLSDERNFPFDVVQQNSSELRETTLERNNYENKVHELQKTQKELELRNTKCNEILSELPHIRNTSPNSTVTSAIWCQSHPILTSPFASTNPSHLYPQNNKGNPEEIARLELLRTLGPQQDLPLDLSIKNKASCIIESENDKRNKFTVKHETFK